MNQHIDKATIIDTILSMMLSLRGVLQLFQSSSKFVLVHSVHDEQPPIQMQDWNIVPVPSEPLLILSDIYVLLFINELYIMVCGQWQQNLSILVIIILCVVHVQTKKSYIPTRSTHI